MSCGLTPTSPRDSSDWVRTPRISCGSGSVPSGHNSVWAREPSPGRCFSRSPVIPRWIPSLADMPWSGWRIRMSMMRTEVWRRSWTGWLPEPPIRKRTRRWSRSREWCCSTIRGNGFRPCSRIWPDPSKPSGVRLAFLLASPRWNRRSVRHARVHSSTPIFSLSTTPTRSANASCAGSARGVGSRRTITRRTPGSARGQGMSTKDTVAVASRLPPLDLGTVERQVQQTGAYSALEEPLDPVDFPAWLLLREPGLLHHLDRVDTPVPEGVRFWRWSNSCATVFGVPTKCLPANGYSKSALRCCAPICRGKQDRPFPGR